jgi:hypothetical protein
MLIRGLTVKGIEVRSTSSAISSDEYFNLVSLLLPGTGTNGAPNNTFQDSSTNNFTVTRNGNTTQGTFSPFSQTGWSNYFDGSGDSITAPDNVALEFGSGDFTIEASVYLTAYSSSYSGFYGTYVVAKDSSGARSYAFYITSTVSSFTGIGLVTFDGSGNANLNFSASASLNLNTWYHIAVSRSGTTFRLFLDGSLIGSTTSAVSILDTATPTRIGAGAYSGFEYYLTGYISNVRIVKGTAVYTAAFTPPSAPLTAISGTSLLTCQSNRFVDNSSNAFVITVAGNTSVQAFAPFDPTTAYSAGTVGGSGYFDGTGDYLRAPTGSSGAFGTGDFCLEAWYYPTSLTSSYYYVTNLESAGGGDSQWALSGTTTTTRFNGWFAVPINATGAPTVNAWNHVVACRSGTTLSVFLNGTRIGTTTYSTNLFSTNDIRVGAYASGTDPIAGYLSGVRVVKGSSVYDPSASTLTVPTTPPTAISNTSFLLNYTNGGITDVTAKNVLETVGGAAISTAQSKFGGSSMAFDGTGDYLIFPSAQTQNFVYGTGNFTIEFWFYMSALAGSGNYYVLYDGRPSSTSGAYVNLAINNATPESYVNGATVISGSALSANTWYHFAYARSGSSTKMFINGSQVGSTYTDTTNYINGANRPVIGTNGFSIGSSNFNGYIDDLRITKGLARYTTTFTPPTQAFPTQ